MALKRIFEQPNNSNPDNTKNIAFGKSGVLTENMTIAELVAYMESNLDLEGGAWQTPSYNTNFSAGTVPFQYRLTVQGDVQFRGDILSTVTSGVAFTLAVGYRPAEHIKGAFVHSGGVFAYSMSLSNPGELFVVGNWNTSTDNSFNETIPLT